MEPARYATANQGTIDNGYYRQSDNKETIIDPKRARRGREARRDSQQKARPHTRATTTGTVPLQTTKQPKPHGQQGQPASVVMASAAPRRRP